MEKDIGEIVSKILKVPTIDIVFCYIIFHNLLNKDDMESKITIEKLERYKKLLSENKLLDLSEDIFQQIEYNLELYVDEYNTRRQN